MAVGLRKRFRVELGLAGVCFVLLIASLVQKDWLERALGFDPDRGTGSVEVLVTLLGALGTIAFMLLARPVAGTVARIRVEPNRVHQSLWCAECGAESEPDAVGWRAGYVHDLDAHEPQHEVIVFCPDCYAREFLGD